MKDKKFFSDFVHHRRHLKVLYYLCPIGPPRLGSKLEIQKENLESINHRLENLKKNKKISNFTLDVIVNSYCPEKEGKERVKKAIEGLEFISNAYFHFREGMLAEVFLRCPHNSKVSQYDYIFFILDDVKITKPFSLPRLFTAIHKHSLDAISPRIKNPSEWAEWYNSDTPKRALHLHAAAEIFLFILPGTSFKKFFTFFGRSNPSFWGLDHCWHHFKFRVGVSTWDTCHHKFKDSKRRAGQNMRDMWNWCKNVLKTKPHNWGQLRRETLPNKGTVYLEKLETNEFFHANPKDKKKALDDPFRLNKIGNTQQIHTNSLKELTGPEWDELSHKEKYDLAIKWDWSIHNGKRLREVQPKYDPAASHFYPQ